MSFTLVDTDILIDAALQVDDAIKCLDFMKRHHLLRPVLLLKWN